MTAMTMVLSGAAVAAEASARSNQFVRATEHTAIGYTIRATTHELTCDG